MSDLKEINPITAKMPWNFENDIGYLTVAISYLKQAALKSEWVDDGSGQEYSQKQYRQAEEYRQAAINEINQAMQHIDCIDEQEKPEIKTYFWHPKYEPEKKIPRD